MSSYDYMKPVRSVPTVEVERFLSLSGDGDGSPLAYLVLSCESCDYNDSLAIQLFKDLDK